MAGGQVQARTGRRSLHPATEVRLQGESPSSLQQTVCTAYGSPAFAPQVVFRGLSCVFPLEHFFLIDIYTFYAQRDPGKLSLVLLRSRLGRQDSNPVLRGLSLCPRLISTWDLNRATVCRQVTPWQVPAHVSPSSVHTDGCAVSPAWPSFIPCSLICTSFYEASFTHSNTHALERHSPAAFISYKIQFRVFASPGNDSYDCCTVPPPFVHPNPLSFEF